MGLVLAGLPRLGAGRLETSTSENVGGLNWVGVGAGELFFLRPRRRVVFCSRVSAGWSDARVDPDTRGSRGKPQTQLAFFCRHRAGRLGPVGGCEREEGAV